MAAAVKAAHVLTFPVQHFNIHVWYSLYLRKERAGGQQGSGRGTAVSGQLSLNSSTPVPLHSRIYTDPENAEHNHQWKYYNRSQ